MKWKTEKNNTKRYEVSEKENTVFLVGKPFSVGAHMTAGCWGGTSRRPPQHVRLEQGAACPCHRDEESL